VSTHYHILDVRGLIIRAWSTGEKVVQDGDRKLVSWEEGVQRFYDQVLKELFDKGVSPTNVIACWDGGNNYRLQLFPDYKKKRMAKEKSEVSAELMKTLFTKCQDLMLSLGIKQARVHGEEADDLIALFCQRLKDCFITVYTVDEDLIQLVSDTVFVEQAHDLISIDTLDWHQTSKGTPVKFLRLYKSLVGDSSDEYKGIPQFGPAAFQRLRDAYKDDGLEQLEEIIKTNNFRLLEQIQQTAQDKDLQRLLEYWSDWRLSYTLACVHPECCYGFNYQTPKRPEITARVPNRDKAAALLNEAGILFRLEELEQFFPVAYAVQAKDHEYLQAIASEIFSSPVVSYDYESSDKKKYQNYRDAIKDSKRRKNFVDVLSQELAGISVNFGRHMEKTIYIAFDHKDADNFSLDWAKWLHQVLDQRTGPTVVQNAAFEVAVCARNLGVFPRAPFDTQIMASYVDENEEAGLKAMSKRLLDYQQVSYEETTQGRDMCELTLEEVFQYGIDDSLVTSHIFSLFRLVMQLEGSWDFYCANEIEPVLGDAYTFIAGTDIDVERTKKLGEENVLKLKQLNQELRDLLKTHCVWENENDALPYAKTLFNEWWQVEHLKHLGQPEEEQKLSDLRTRLWQRAWYSCFYQDYVIDDTLTKTGADVTPTPKAISTLANQFVEGAPALTKQTKSAVEDWESAVADFIGTNKGEPYEHLNMLAGLVYAARSNLTPAKRSGGAWDDLCDFFANHYKTGKKKVVMRGDELNMSSPPQMQGLLYGKLRLPIRVRSKVKSSKVRMENRLPGSPATGLKAITAAIVYDLKPEDWRYKVLECYRQISLAEQNQSLYFDSYPKWVSPEDGKIHPQIKNCGTVTRRPSGGNPNVLQVSNKGDAIVRKLFVAGKPEEERVYVSIDWQSQELLILACESRDPVLLDAFTSNPRRDIHAKTGAAMVSAVFPRLGGPAISSMSYEEFVEALHDSGHDLHPYVSQTRKKYAKACIAGGSLVLTDQGMVPIEQVTTDHKVWDGVEWVSHEGVIYKGIREVITYDGLTATPDHKVFTQEGWCAPLGDCSSQPERPRLAQGEVDGRPVRFEGDNRSGLLEAGGEESVESLPVREVSVHGLRQRRGIERRQRTDREKQKVFELPKKVEEFSRTHLSKALRRCLSEMSQSAVKVFQKLWGPWNTDAVYSGGVRVLHSATLPYGELQRAGCGQDRQRQALRTWKYQTSAEKDKLSEQAQHYLHYLQGNEDSGQPSLACFESRKPRVYAGKKDCSTASKGRLILGTDKRLQTQASRAPVYDIVNAGPRHRFTVSGKVVRNCNFGLAFGGTEHTLAENLLIEIGFAEDLMNSTLNLYKRIKPWQREVAEFARKHGYAETAYGNRRHATKDLMSTDKRESQRMERQLANAVIQSTAADILKVTRQEMRRRQMIARYDLRAVKPIYDELTASVPAKLAVEYTLEMAEIMRIQPPGYPVALDVDIEIGRTWGDQLEVGAAEAGAIQTVLDKVMS
jgi:DNA polymerase I-like protein with 3'-5' exonuclease and polymerase domains